MDLNNEQKSRSLTLLYKDITSFEVGSRLGALPASPPPDLLPTFPPPPPTLSMPASPPLPPPPLLPSSSQPLLLCLIKSGLSAR